MTAATCVWDGRAVLGEGLVWDAGRRVFWFVDIKGGRLHRHDLATGETHDWTVPGGMLTTVDVTADGRLIGTTRNALVKIKVGDPSEFLDLDHLAHPPEWHERLRFNDGAFAPDGAFWAGFMDDSEEEALGGWWRFAPDGAATLLGGDIKVANGPAFDAASGLTYLTDSARGTVWVMDGTTAEAFETRRVFRQFDGDRDGYPDGMTVDAQGRVWIAFWDGARVQAFEPDGAEGPVIETSALRPTKPSIAEGRIYATSAAIGLSRDPDLGDGGLFRADLP
jgi:D-xylonolactonase